jgi:hypothetical protein
MKQLNPNVPQNELLLKLSRFSKRPLDNLHEQLLAASKDSTANLQDRATTSGISTTGISTTGGTRSTSTLRTMLTSNSSTAQQPTVERPSATCNTIQQQSTNSATCQQLIDIANLPLAVNSTTPRKHTPPTETLPNATNGLRMNGDATSSDILEQFADNL